MPPKNGATSKSASSTKENSSKKASKSSKKDSAESKNASYEKSEIDLAGMVEMRKAKEAEAALRAKV